MDIKKYRIVSIEEYINILNSDERYVYIERHKYNLDGTEILLEYIYPNEYEDSLTKEEMNELRNHEDWTPNELSMELDNLNETNTEAN